MTPIQRTSKNKAVKIQRLRLQTSEARTDADDAASVARAARSEFKKARKAYKLAKRTAKESRKTLEAMVRKLKKIAPTKSHPVKSKPAAVAAAKASEPQSA